MSYHYARSRPRYKPDAPTRPGPLTDSPDRGTYLEAVASMIAERESAGIPVRRRGRWGKRDG